MRFAVAAMVVLCIWLAVIWWFEKDYKNTVLMLTCALSFLISYITLTK